MRLTTAAIAIALAAPAAAEPYVMDKSHASVGFRVDHLGFSAVSGQFREFDAQIDFDPKAVEDTRVRFVIDAASIDTNWRQRDEALRGADFFDVARYPQIVFESTAVTPTGANRARVEGRVTLRGVTREVAFDAVLNKIGPSPFDPDLTVAGFTVTGEIDRTEFDMGFGAPDIGGEVVLRVDLEMSPAG